MYKIVSNYINDIQTFWGVLKNEVYYFGLDRFSFHQLELGKSLKILFFQIRASAGGGGGEKKHPHRPLVLCPNLPDDHGHFDEV